MIEASAVSVRLGRRVVLRGVSARLEPEKLTAIVGPNGSGKSTLLATLAGELALDGGRVLLDGAPMASVSLERRARSRAMLVQDPELAFDFTVGELVSLGRAVHDDLETSASKRIVAQCLETVGLADRASDVVTELSGGERQRAHLARVLSQLGLGETGKHLLLDEPGASLDPPWQLRVLEICRELAARGVAVGVVLHDLDLAGRFADHVIVLSTGVVAAAGPPREVLTEAVIERVFGARVTVELANGAPRVTFHSAR
ncbi:MAG: heme ABC transporter ATP-binding protein [Polyangiaceae bacterium]